MWLLLEQSLRCLNITHAIECKFKPQRDIIYHLSFWLRWNVWYHITWASMWGKKHPTCGCWDFGLPKHLWRIMRHYLPELKIYVFWSSYSASKNLSYLFEMRHVFQMFHCNIFYASKILEMIPVNSRPLD